ncbi:MAG: AAA-like domain-containing protein [Lachnospiraceae bacterium]|nr:AAA-like domain-containing protein [Lachnospiraceae bacterium]
MVDISDTLDKMRDMVDEGTYFTINRGRQYGKTTTLSLLCDRLESAGYVVFFISFEALDEKSYATEENFYQSFIWLLYDQISYNLVKNASEELKTILEKNGTGNEGIDGRRINTLISEICKAAGRDIVILIDEVDQAGNYQTFLKFLGLLRNRYLNRNRMPAFHSVILAGVYDIKNLKLKIRPEEEHQYNSPWNIAVNYSDDMALKQNGIAGMLSEYEADHSTGMDVDAMAKLLWDYTSGYPFLVSRLCMLMDEEGKEDSWAQAGFQRAVKHILVEQNTLFDDLAKKLAQFPSLHDMLYEMLYTGEKFAFNTYEKAFNLAVMFGYIVNRDNKAAVGNRIFEIWLYDLFAVEAALNDDEVYNAGSMEKSQFIKDGTLDMKRILERFIVHYNDIYGNRDERFHEKEGRKYFLFYLKPIINGTGNYYVETETLNEGRMDVVVDYLGKQYVVELKIWRGQAYHEEGERQLTGYLESLHLTRGYMLTFNFNQKKETGIQEITLNGKTLVEAVV